MKILHQVLCAALIAAPMVASAADEKGCDSVNWSEEVLTKFPNAQKACHGMTMKNGAAYAHYVAEVVSANAEAVTVDLLDKKGKGISQISFVPDAERIAKAGVKFKDLEKGTKLDLYIEHNRWGLYASPDSTPMTILSRKDL